MAETSHLCPRGEPNLYRTLMEVTNFNTWQQDKFPAEKKYRQCGTTAQGAITSQACDQESRQRGGCVLVELLLPHVVNRYH